MKWVQMNDPHRPFAIHRVRGRIIGAHKKWAAFNQDEPRIAIVASCDMRGSVGRFAARVIALSRRAATAGYIVTGHVASLAFVVLDAVPDGMRHMLGRLPWG